MRKIKLGIVMDPIESLTPYKDSTVAMLAEAHARGWNCSYLEQKDLYIEQGRAFGRATPIQINTPPSTLASNIEDWCQLGAIAVSELGGFDIILMRKDPPFDINYIYTTQILSLAEQQGAKVFNRPQSLRDFNEKLFIADFPQCCTPTLITNHEEQVKQFREDHGTLILKPLDGMGGSGIFKVAPEDANLSVIMSILTNQGQTPIMAQRFIPEISDGDKRILLINGEPIPYALARIPQEGQVRGNLAAGGVGKSRELSDRDRWICEQLAPTLKERGLIFVGIDVIGDYLTEINVTSPTCIRELDQQNSINISARLMDALEQQLY